METTPEPTALEVRDQPKLVFRSGPSRGVVVAIEKDRITLGRDAGNDVRIDDEIVSSRHAIIERRRGPESMLWIEDLGSKNGTFVNGKRVQKVPLHDGDVFCLCQTGAEIQFTVGKPSLPSILATSTQTFARTGSFESAVRELLPQQKKQRLSLSKTGVREVLGQELAENSRKSRRAILWAAAGLCGVLLAGFVLLAWSLSRGPEPVVQGSPRAETLTPLEQEPPPEVGLSLELEPIYSSLFHSYRREGIGSVQLRNTGEQPLRGARFTFWFEGEGREFLVQSIEVDLPDLEPDGVWETDIRPYLSRKVVHDRPKEVSAVAAVTVRGELLTRSTRAVTVHDYHAFNWERPERIAVFIDSADAAVLAFVDAAFRQSPHIGTSQFPPINVVRAITVLTALAQRGIRYKPDAITSISVDTEQKASDRVNYPGETLLRGTGDCDDLVVLCCSVLEAANVPCSVVVKKSHVLFLLDTGLQAETATSGAATGLFDPRSAVVDGEQRVWLPIEATELAREGGGFTSAWGAAWRHKAEIESGDLPIVDVREAWRDFKALNPEPTEDVRAMIRKPQTWTLDAAEIREKIRRELDNLRAEARKALDGQLEELRSSLDGIELVQASAQLFATNGLYDEAIQRLEASLFPDGVPSIDELETSDAERSLDDVVLLVDLGLAESLAYRGPAGLDRAAAYLRLALAELPEDLPEVGELMLRLSIIERMRGKLRNSQEWIAKALEQDPSLETTRQLLEEGDGSVASRSGRTEKRLAYLREGLRGRPLREADSLSRNAVDR